MGTYLLVAVQHKAGLQIEDHIKMGNKVTFPCVDIPKPLNAALYTSRKGEGF